MNPAQVGKVLALVSPALAVGVVCFMLFATGYSQVSMEERAGSEGDPVEAASESGWMSAYEYSLENGDYAFFLWSGFIVIICLLAAGAALKGWVGLVWACAGLLGVVSILGAMSIGGMVAPLVLILLVSAILLSLSGPEGS
jgi:uncharacterized membrane protein